MCTAQLSTKSSSLGNIYFVDNDNDSLSFDNGSDKEKEENFFKEIDSDSHDNIIERSKDEHYGKVFNIFNILIINIIIIIQFDDILGIGTFKTIFKGYDYNLGREIAWCEVNVEENDNKNYMPPIVENIENIKKLKHPNLLEYISVWHEEAKNKVVVITELLQGGNLREHRKYQKRLKIKLIKKWIKQILSALDYLHSNGYIHHDIKGQNILVDRNSGNLKLGDLICAEKLGDRKYFTKYIGTEQFMAPEVKDGKYTFKADVYSFGLTIVQLLTMEKPYKEFQRKKYIYEAKKNGVYPLSFNQIKNEEIKNFIKLCLKDENERPTCKELLQNKWLNDNESPGHNSYIEIINSLRQQNFIYNKLSSTLSNYNDLNRNISFESCNSLSNLNIYKQDSMGPIYSLDISKLTKKNEKNDLINKLRLNSVRIKSSVINQAFKSVSSLNVLKDQKIKEFKGIFSDKKKSKYFKGTFSVYKQCDSSELFKNDEEKNINLLAIYLYITEYDCKLFLKFKEEQEQNENILFTAKIVFSTAKWKKEKLNQVSINMECEYNSEKKDMEIIIENLQKIIYLNKNEILYIKKKLNGKISKIIKKKKLRDFNEKIKKIISNFELLINNEEFDYLEYIINSADFNESKYPKEISDKLKYYKNKKKDINNLFNLHNLNNNEDYNNNYKLKCQEYVILDIFDVDNN